MQTNKLLLVAVLFAATSVSASVHLFRKMTVNGASAIQQSSGDVPNSTRLLGSAASVKYIAGQFETSSAYTFTRFDASLQKLGSPTGNLTGYLYQSVPNEPGTLLGTSTNTVDSATLTNSYVDYQFDFADVPLTTGTKYHVVLMMQNVSGSNYLRWEAQSGSGRISSSSNGASWSFFETRALTFSVWGY